MSKVFIGPLTMEFGHEVMSTGVMRHVFRKSKEVIVSSFPDRFPLYDDIAHVFIPHNIVCSTDCAWAIRGDRQRVEVEAVAFIKQHCPDGFVQWLPEPQMYKSYNPRSKAIYQILGRLGAEPSQIVFHARNRVDVSVDRNWLPKSWEKLAQLAYERFQGQEIISVGHRSDSYHIVGTTDMRGVPLGRLMDVMRNSIMVVGPSSGPIHLASLCNAPHVTWNGEGGPDTPRWKALRMRYVTGWNKHVTPVQFLNRCTWQPTPEEILNEMGQLYMEAVDE